MARVRAFRTLPSGKQATVSYGKHSWDQNSGSWNPKPPLLPALPGALQRQGTHHLQYEQPALSFGWFQPSETLPHAELTFAAGGSPTRVC